MVSRSLELSSVVVLVSLPTSCGCSGNAAGCWRPRRTRTKWCTECRCCPRLIRQDGEQPDSRQGTSRSHIIEWLLTSRRALFADNGTCGARAKAWQKRAAVAYVGRRDRDFHRREGSQQKKTRKKQTRHFQNRPSRPNSLNGEAVCSIQALDEAGKTNIAAT